MNQIHVQILQTVIAAASGLLASLATARAESERAAANLAALKTRKAELIASVTSAPDSAGDEASLNELGRLNSGIEMASAVAARAEKKAEQAKAALDSGNGEHAQQVRSLAISYYKEAMAGRVEALRKMLGEWFGKPDGKLSDYLAKECIEKLAADFRRRNSLLRSTDKQFAFLGRAGTVVHSDAEGGVLLLAQDLLAAINAAAGEAEAEEEPLLLAIDSAPLAFFENAVYWLGTPAELAAGLPAEFRPEGLDCTPAALANALTALAVRRPDRVRPAEDGGWVILPGCTYRDLSGGDEDEDGSEPEGGVGVDDDEALNPPN